MTVRVHNWALCEDCECPRVLMPDQKRCARCLGSNLRTLVALRNEAGNPGIATLSEAAIIVRPKRRPEWLRSVKNRNRDTFPKALFQTTRGIYYDLDEVIDWAEKYIASPPKDPRHGRRKIK